MGTAVRCCSILHWFDRDLLGTLLGSLRPFQRPPLPVDVIMNELRELSFVSAIDLDTRGEPQRYAIHGSVQRAVLDHVWRTDQGLYVDVSRAAATYFSAQATLSHLSGESAGEEYLAEWVYHMSALPDDSSFRNLWLILESSLEAGDLPRARAYVHALDLRLQSRMVPVWRRWDLQLLLLSALMGVGDRESALATALTLMRTARGETTSDRIALVLQIAADCYATTGRPGDAAWCYSLAITLRRDEADSTESFAMPISDAKMSAMLLNYGVALGLVGRMEESFAAYSELEDRYAGNQSDEILAAVAASRFNHALALSDQGRLDDAADMLEDIARRYVNSDDPSLTLAASAARAHLLALESTGAGQSGAGRIRTADVHHGAVVDGISRLVASIVHRSQHPHGLVH